MKTHIPITTQFDAENRLCPRPAWWFNFDRICLFILFPLKPWRTQSLCRCTWNILYDVGAHIVFDTKSLVHVEGSSYNCSPEWYFPVFLASLFMNTKFRCKMPCFIRSLHETLKTSVKTMCSILPTWNKSVCHLWRHKVSGDIKIKTYTSNMWM